MVIILFVQVTLSIGYGPRIVVLRCPAVILLLKRFVMAVAEEKWQIDKLSTNNYNLATWKFQIKYCLMAKNLWEIVDGTETLADGASQQQRQEFRKRRNKAAAVIVTSVKPELCYLLTSCDDDPHDMWEALRQHFERDTTVNKVFLKKQLVMLKMQEGTPVQDHLRRMKELTDRLASINAAVDDEDQMVYLLSSLPESYSVLVTALETREGLTLQDVQRALVSEELKREQAGETSVAESSGLDSALKAMKKPGRQETVEKSPLKCYWCQREGHFQRDCPFKHKQPKKWYNKSVKYRARAARHQYVYSESDSDSPGDIDARAFVASLDKTSGVRWIIDSGATRHMTFQRELLVDYCQFSSPEKVGLGDGRTVDAFGTGRVKVSMPLGRGKQFATSMTGVLYVPQLSCNLFSVSAAALKGNVVQFGHPKCWIRDKNGKLVGKGQLVDKMYHLHCKIIPAPKAEQTSVASNQGNKADLWHQRLGHINEDHLKRIAKKKLVKGMDYPIDVEMNFCEGCIEGKMHRKTHRSVGEFRSTKIMQLVHSDVCGPMQTKSIGGSRYFVTFIDDFSHYTEVYFMKRKSEVLSKFKEFEAQATNWSGCQIKTLRTDGGGEYTSDEFQQYMKLKGIHHDVSMPYTPQQNGVAERMNRTLVESARSMLAHCGLSNTCWAEAINTATYVRNRAATTAIKSEQTPYELWHGKKPDVSYFRVFGCMAYTRVPDIDRRKLDKKAMKVRFVGYSGRKGYRLLDEQRHKIIVRYDVDFNETDFGRSEMPEQQSVEFNSKESVGAVDDNHQESIQPVVQEKPQRERRAPVRFGYDEYADVTQVATQHFALRVTDIIEPTTIDEALKSDQAEHWKAAADLEYASLIENDTWELATLPDGREVIGYKWVFRVKHDSEGKVERFKGRLVAKGYSQQYGIDYDETFSPVVRFSSIRTLLAYAVQQGMLIHHMDVVTAFLNGQLHEEIYMKQPPGYIQPGQEELVCRLKKSLYGLKQSPRCWNLTFCEHMKSMGFKQCDADPCIFIRKGSELSIVAVYVDDLILITETVDEMQQIKANLANRFKMTDMGQLRYCLGVSINIDEGKQLLELSQKQYIQKLLERYGLCDANSVSTPVDLNVKLVKDDGHSKLVDPVLYQSIIGSLLYAAIATRPDISHAVGMLSKFCSKPSEAHLTAVKRILRYLKGTVSLTLQYQRQEKLTVIGYSDADWANDLDNRHSVTGNVFIMTEGAVNWLSQKQATVALSTAEAEYVALSSAAQEVIWLRRLLSEINVDISKPTIIREDNKGAIAMSRNPIGHKRTKHIDIRHHFIREQVDSGTVMIEYCPTSDMIADILTKSLPKR